MGESLGVSRMSLQERGGKKEGPGNESITSYLVVLEALNRV